MIQKKIVLLGMYGVGKTSLIRRFVDDLFSDNYLTTIGVKVTQKLCTPVADSSGKLHQFNFMLWDIEGKREDQELPKNYLLGASGGLLVADLTRKFTIDFLTSIKQNLLDMLPDVKIVIIGNKTDLVEDTESFEKYFIDLSQQEWPYYFSSAKTGEHVEACFLRLAELFVQ